MSKKFSLEEAVEMLLNVETISDTNRRRLSLIQRKESYKLNRDFIIELYDKHFMYGVE